MDLRLKPAQVAVIGAGYAGIAAAVELARRDHRVTLFEAGRVAGGRARRLGQAPHGLDNGQHLLLGAYRETLALMRSVGADPDRLLLRHPLALDVAGGVGLRLPAWPAPLHVLAGLATATGLDRSARARLLAAMLRLQLARFRVPAGMTVAAWLAAPGQGPALVDGFWTPLVLAAMNTPPAKADMQILANVLRDSLAAGRAASDLLIPRTDLSALLPEPAIAWLGARGHAYRPGCRVQRIVPVDAGVDVDGQHFDGCVLATAPQHLSALLPADRSFDDLRSRVNSIAFQPIYTVYLRARTGARLPLPMMGLAGGIAQWVFDRGQFSDQEDLFAVVISGPGAHEAWDHAEIGQRVAAELAQQWPQLDGVEVLKVIAERRATFSCEAGMQRLRTDTPHARLRLAGDGVQNEYPATIEGAVRSGLTAARALDAGLKQENRT